MKNKTVFVSAEGFWQTLWLLLVGYAVGLIMLWAWPMLQNVTTKWPANILSTAGFYSMLGAYLLITIAGSGVQNSRWFQLGMVTVTITYGISLLREYNWAGVVSLGPMLVSSLFAILTTPPPAEQKTPTLKGWRVVIIAVLAAAIATPIALFWPKMLPQNSLLVWVSGVLTLISYCGASVGYAANLFAGNSLWYRGLKVFGNITMLVVNLGQTSPASVLFNAAVLIEMLLFTLSDHFRKNQNPPSS